MPDYGLPIDSGRPDRGNSNALDLVKAFIGSILIVIGVIIALYAAITAFNLISGSDVPPWMKPTAEKVLDEAEAKAQAQLAAAPFDLSPDLKKMIFVLLTFMLLVIPSGIGTSLIASGVRLMQGDTIEALGRIAEQMKKSK